MDRPLAGRVILVIEDEPLVALGISDALQDVGAKTMTARTLAAASLLVTTVKALLAQRPISN